MGTGTGEGDRSREGDYSVMRGRRRHRVRAPRPGREIEAGKGYGVMPREGRGHRDLRCVHRDWGGRSKPGGRKDGEGHTKSRVAAGSHGTRDGGGVGLVMKQWRLYIGKHDRNDEDDDRNGEAGRPATVITCRSLDWNAGKGPTDGDGKTLETRDDDSKSWRMERELL